MDRCLTAVPSRGRESSQAGAIGTETRSRACFAGRQISPRKARHCLRSAAPRVTCVTEFPTRSGMAQPFPCRAFWERKQPDAHLSRGDGARSCCTLGPRSFLARRDFRFASDKSPSRKHTAASRDRRSPEGEIGDSVGARTLAAGCAAPMAQQPSTLAARCHSSSVPPFVWAKSADGGAQDAPAKKRRPPGRWRGANAAMGQVPAGPAGLAAERTSGGCCWPPAIAVVDRRGRRWWTGTSCSDFDTLILARMGESDRRQSEAVRLRGAQPLQPDPSRTRFFFLRAGHRALPGSESTHACPPAPFTLSEAVAKIGNDNIHNRSSCGSVCLRHRDRRCRWRATDYARLQDRGGRKGLDRRG